jgi:hypothetical protein
MPLYDKAVIQGYLKRVDRARGKNQKAAKGKAFEELARYLFSGIPGVRITSWNQMNTFATEEIDIACFNIQDPAGLITLPPNFLVECKGWRDPVNSEQVAWFLTKIRHRGLDFGILIAAKGITGVPEHLTAAHLLVALELGATRSIRMIIVTRAEIEALNSGEEFALMILEKVNRLYATGRCY